jgi:aldose 1-epimerase
MRRKVWISLGWAIAAILMLGCGEINAMSIKTESFGKTPDGQAVDLYTLTNQNGLKAKITNYGAILVSMEAPDRKGNLADLTLGYDNLEQYIKRGAFFGATVGRYANRIGGAKFVLDGVEYKLAANSGANHIHGGKKGFDKVLWKLEDIKAQGDEAFVRLSYLSKDGEEGYPGNLACTLTYTLTSSDELKISYEAETDKTTIVNLTNHSYWNLAGQGNGDVLGHELMLNVDRYTVFGEGLIPTGEIRSVKDSPLDFTKPTAIGTRIKQVGSGYDHNYVLNGSGGKLALCARVYEPTSGRVMEVHTTEPGVQLYTANFLDVTGKDGKAYKKHYGFCLETQHFPDSPNKPNFPSVVLKPGEKYASVTVHRFYTR